MLKKLVLLTLVALFSCKNKEELKEIEGYTLIWNDEFNIDGPLNSDKWGYEEGFIRNKELQWYQSENAICKDGFLVVQGKKERVKNTNYKEGSDDWKENRPYAEYTSASAITRDKFSFTFGKVVFRAKIKTVEGLWPAIWMLGQNRSEYGWPYCGEIDIMEYFKETLLANACWKGEEKGSTWDDSKTPIKDFNDSEWDEKFHIWTMDWDKDKIDFYVDNQLLNTVDISNIKTFNTDENPFHKKFYFVVNLALGATGGSLDDVNFPTEFLIDYIRVYKEKK